jgi:hypothetical protein
METLDKAAGVVAEDGASSVLMSRTLSPLSRAETTANRRLVLVLINRDALAWLKIVGFEDIFFGLGGGKDFGIAPLSTSNLAGAQSGGLQVRAESTLGTMHWPRRSFVGEELEEDVPSSLGRIRRWR